MQRMSNISAFVPTKNAKIPRMPMLLLIETVWEVFLWNYPKM